MEPASCFKDRDNPSPANSPAGGATAQTPPLTPISRSDPIRYPTTTTTTTSTTFVQADTSNFKQVVQMLTGSSERTELVNEFDPIPAKVSIPPIKSGQQKKQGFMLHKRRDSLKSGMMIYPNSVHGFRHWLSPKSREILSPSVLDFPAMVLSPVTPLNEDAFGKSSTSVGSCSEEDRAIAEKGFYFHPSPRTATPRGAEPQLLELFPVTPSRVEDRRNNNVEGRRKESFI